MQEERIFVFSDRDGVINVDNDYYLGSSDAWQAQLEFLPGVPEGIKTLNNIPGLKFIIVTSQSGIALGGEEFAKLTPERLGEVHEEIISRLEKKSARIDAVFFCGYVTKAYVREAAAKGRIVLEEYVSDNAPCIKPRTGMLEEGAHKFGTTLSAVRRKFMIGDLARDIEMGLCGGCVSILIPSRATEKKRGEFERVEALRREHPKHIFIAKNFLDAAQLIEKMIHET